MAFGLLTVIFFFFNDTATTEIYTLSLHDALPICAAHEKLQDFLSTFSGTEFEDDALTQEFLIAEVFLSGTRRKVLGLRILRADDIGIAILDDIAVNHPDTRLGELAIMTKANHYYENGDFDIAEHEYNQLVQEYGRSRYTRPALLQGARAALASFGGVRFDDAPLIEADDRFRRYIAQYPGSAEQEGIGLILGDIQETRAAKELNIGEYYERAGKPGAAKFYYGSVREHWPESRAAIRAAERAVSTSTRARRAGRRTCSESASRNRPTRLGAGASPGPVHGVRASPSGVLSGSFRNLCAPATPSAAA